METERPPTTLRTARKRHLCSYCWWKARRDAGFPRWSIGVEASDEHYIDKGVQFVECYAYGTDPFHPARYHVPCFEEMHR